MNIKTSHNGFEWTAIDDATYSGPPSPVGTGRSKAEAIADLKEQLPSDQTAPTPRCIPHCPVCDKAAAPMPLADYLNKGGPMCCGVQTRLAT